jgi:uncharacterized protein YndB with AHSA1/START domain
MPHAHCHSITIERHFAARVEEVFEAWTKPELRARWFAPTGVIAVADGDTLRRGSRETIMEHVGATLQFHDITYLEVEAPRRISYRADTYMAGRHVAVVAVTVEFDTAACGTRLSICHDTLEVAGASDQRTDAVKPFVAPEERLVAARGRGAPF